MVNLLNALMVTRMLTREHPQAEAVSALGSEIPFGDVWWFVYAGISCFLVLFAGIMSGLTLGLMSLGLVDLEILQRSGSPSEKKQAAVILPVVQKQHQLLVTLLLCNAAAMELLALKLAICRLFPYTLIRYSTSLLPSFSLSLLFSSSGRLFHKQFVVDMVLL